VLTQDWHPCRHLSFASTHPGKHPFETVTAPYGPQVLWPDHCVQGKPGAGVSSGAAIPHAGLILRKGMDPAIDSYSALYENDRMTPTGLVGYLRERDLTRIFLPASPSIVCVRYSAEDACREDFTVFVVEDACRSIDVDGSVRPPAPSLTALRIPVHFGVRRRFLTGASRIRHLAQAAPWRGTCLDSREPGMTYPCR